MIQKAKPEKEKRVDFYSQGLCSTCIYNSGCGFKFSQPGPVFYCEEFCCLDAGQDVRLEARIETGPSTPAGRMDFMGLCINCDNRTGCVLSHAEGGVWYCEEYV